MRVTFTQPWLLAQLREPRDKTADFADTQTPGLTLRINPGGTVSWSTRRVMPDGRYTRVTLGTYPATSLAEARRRALQAKSALEGGRDHNLEKRAAKAEAEVRAARMTVAEAWTAYCAARVAAGAWGEAHALERRRFLDRVIRPAVGGETAVADVSRENWTKLIAEQGGRRGPGSRANALRLIRSFDAYCEVSGWIERAKLPRKASLLAPPCPPRQHTPSDGDVAAVWRAAEGLRPQARCYVRLLILTAARRNEVAGLRSGEVDLGAGLWRLPPSRAKNRTPHLMPLGHLALAELRAIWPQGPVGPGFCLLGETGRSGLQDFSKVKKALDLAIGDSGWRVHDLRRSARTGMARLGVDRDAAETALNHVSGRSALERTYNTHGFQQEGVAALRVWQAHVARLVSPPPGAEVIAFPGAKAG